MTGEEAKKWLNKLLARADITDEYGDMEDMQPYEEAVNMAIKDIETVEEFEKAQIITGGRLNGRTYAYKCGLEDGIRKALEREPKTGHWIFKQRHKNVDVCCSVCGYIRIVDYAYGYTVEELEERNAMEEVLAKGDLRVCEKCGAKMEGEK